MSLLQGYLYNSVFLQFMKSYLRVDILKLLYRKVYFAVNHARSTDLNCVVGLKLQESNSQM